jgi:aminopeptidase N
VPLSVWTFPEDSAFAVNGPFKRAAAIVDAFTRLVGPFPYEKLAHVESSTRFGGMENSSAIFYDERKYGDRTMQEDVVAHETAHQWFGDAVTEADWHHLWLSEGFASYFAPLFHEAMHESTTFRARLDGERRVYLASTDVARPVIDTAEHDLFKLLNRNNYQKGALILHMLRREVGDSAFFQGLRTYFATFRDSTALTSDLAAVMSRAAGRPLDTFFRQWLLQPGYPKLYLTSHCQNGRLAVEIEQIQPDSWGLWTMQLPVDIGGIRTTILIDGRVTKYTHPSCGDVTLDPARDYLLEVSQPLR